MREHEARTQRQRMQKSMCSTLPFADRDDKGSLLRVFGSRLFDGTELPIISRSQTQPAVSDKSIANLSVSPNDSALQVRGALLEKKKKRKH